MHHYNINNGLMEPSKDGPYVMYDDIKGYLEDLVRQPHTVSLARAERHHNAIAELLELFNLPAFGPPIPRDSRHIIEYDASQDPISESPPPKRRRGRPPKREAPT